MSSKICLIGSVVMGAAGGCGIGSLFDGQSVMWCIPVILFVIWELFWVVYVIRAYNHSREKGR